MDNSPARLRCSTTLAGYLDLAGPSPADLPVYDPTGRFSWPRRIAERFGAPIVPAGPAAPDRDGDALAQYRRSGAAARARPEHLVVALTGDDYAYAAAVFATIRRCTLARLGTPEGIAARARELRARYVTLVGPRGSIRFDLLAALRRELGSRVAVGVLTAPTVAALSELVMKNLLYPRVPAAADTFLDPGYRGAEVIPSGTLTSYLGEACTAEALRPDQPLRVLSVLSHGREDYLKLTGTLLCGRGSEAPPGPGAGPADGTGNGSADGSANGSGNRSANGSGTVSADATGAGSGNGSGTVSADGSADATGNGSADGSDNGSGAVSGAGSGNGSANGSGAVSVDDSAAGSGNGSAGSGSSPGALARAVPACRQGFACVHPERARLDPAQVPAQVVFVNACLSLKFGVSLFGDGFAVSQRFLDGWAAVYVASPLLKTGLPVENLLFHHLVDAGLPVGEAVAVVNQNIAGIGLDAPALTVVGDVEAVYGKGELAQPPEAGVTFHDGYASIDFVGTMPRFAAVPVDDPELLRRYRAGGVEVAADPPFGGKVYCCAGLRDAGDRLQVLVCGVKDLDLTDQGGRRRLVVRQRRPGTDVAALLPAIRRYESLADLDLKLPQVKPAVTELASILPTVARRVTGARVDLTESAAMAKTVDRFRRTFDQLDRDLLALLLKITEKRSYHFVEAYRPSYVVEEVYTGRQPCPYCGEVVYEYELRHVLRPELRRRTLSCPVCGAIRDADDDRLGLDVEGDPALAAGVANRQLIRLANRSAEPLRVRLGARVSKGRDGFAYELDRDLVTLPPGVAETVALRVIPGTPRVRHAVLLRVYAISEGRIYFAGRDLWFAPPEGAPAGPLPRPVEIEAGEVAARDPR